MIGVAMVAATVGIQLAEGKLGLTAGLTVLILAPEMYMPLRRLGAQFHASADGMASAERIFEVLDQPAAVVRGRAGRRLTRRGADPLEGVRFASGRGRRCWRRGPHPGAGRDGGADRAQRRRQVDAAGAAAAGRTEGGHDPLRRRRAARSTARMAAAPGLGAAAPGARSPARSRRTCACGPPAASDAGCSPRPGGRLPALARELPEGGDAAGRAGGGSRPGRPSASPSPVPSCATRRC